MRGSKFGRPRALKPDILRQITQRAITCDTRRELLAAQLEREIEEQNEKSPTIETLKKYISEARNKGSDLLEKPWNTYTLNQEPISTEVVPYLIVIQKERKRFLSKPLTVREARWFNRLFGFKNTLAVESPEIKNDSDLTALFLANVIATWSNFYSSREQIDEISGIKEPDYTDLDSALASLDLSRISSSGQRRLFNNLDSVELIVQRQEDRGKFAVIKPVLIDGIRNVEISVLDHHLGSPDMPVKSIVSYGSALLINIVQNEQWYERLKGLPYLQEIKFFIGLRKHLLVNPDEKRIDRIIATALNRLSQ
jgi:hypothetical protein